MGQTGDVFKAYDIRGTVPDQLDATMCRAIGGAFARFCRVPRILVARDMRPSGEELSAAFAPQRHTGATRLHRQWLRDVWTNLMRIGRRLGLLGQDGTDPRHRDGGCSATFPV